MLENSPNLPRIPQPLQEIIHMVQRPDSVDKQVLTDAIEAQPELESIVLLFINSKYFHTPATITSIGEALDQLGADTMAIVIVTAICRHLLPDGYGRSQVFQKIRYMKHIIATAIISCALVDELEYGDKYKLFAYGLIHDVGIVVLDACAPELLDEIFAMVQQGTPQLTMAEKIIMDGVSHAEIGAWIAEKWELPEAMKDVIANHHWPSLSTQNSLDVQIVHVADSLSATYDNMLLEDKDTDQQRAALRDLGISDESVRRICSTLPAEVLRVIGLFQMVK